MKAKPIGVIRTNGCPKSGEPKQEIPQARQLQPISASLPILPEILPTPKQAQTIAQMTERTQPFPPRLTVLGGDLTSTAVAATAERMRRMQDRMLEKAIRNPSRQVIMPASSKTAPEVRQDLVGKIRKMRVELELIHRRQLQTAMVLNPELLATLPLKQRLRALRWVRMENRRVLQAMGQTPEPWADPATWPPGRRLP
ncbi:hypothetical protein [Rhizobium sp. PAMB 3182]